MPLRGTNILLMLPSNKDTTRRSYAVKVRAHLQPNLLAASRAFGALPCIRLDCVREVNMHLSVRTCLLPLVFAPALFAQVRLTLADAVSQALTGNPRLSVASARIGVAEGLRKQAGLSPNPRLIFQLENSRFWGNPPFSYPQDTASYAFVAQTVEPGGKRNRRVALATENIRSNELEMQLQRYQIVSRVSMTYWAAAGSSRVRDLFQEEVESFARVIQFHRDRVREGGTR
jgi:cobalt-zinc-cadmium efflux system outer membrane protein